MMHGLQTHRIALLEAFRRMGAQPLANLLNLFVLATALWLPIGGYLLLANAEQAAGALGGQTELSLILATDASANDRPAIERTLAGNDAVASFRLISREQALADLRARSGLGDVLDGLPGNPLPDVYVVTPRHTSPTAVKELAKTLGAIPKVASTLYDPEWAARLEAGIAAARFLVAALGSLLAVAMVAVTFNTIRLQVLTAKDEMEIAALLGATPAFLRRPFLYFGGLQGCFAGVLAWVLLALAFGWLRTRLTALIGEFALAVNPVSLSWQDGLGIVLFAACLGWAGAWASARQHGRV